MEDLQRKQCFDAFVKAMRQSAYVAVSLRGRVQSERKNGSVFASDPPSLIIRREAKTVVDEIIQEIILIEGTTVLSLASTSVDAEETTPTVSKYSVRESRQTLVIDPIDGTWNYVNGLSNYSICVGLIEDGKLILALVLFPELDQLFYLDASGNPFRATDVYRHGLERSQPIVAPPTKSTRIYYNSRVPHAVVNRLRDAGYEPHDDSEDLNGCPGAILQCMEGNALAYVAHTRQVRDILLGAILGSVSGGYSRDWGGSELDWGHGGRIPQAIFGFGSLTKEVLHCLEASALV